MNDTDKYVIFVDLSDNLLQKFLDLANTINDAGPSFLFHHNVQSKHHCLTALMHSKLHSI